MTERDLYTEKISYRLDDELTAIEANELNAHVKECATCRRAYEEMTHIDQLLRSAAAIMVAPHPGFRQRFEAGLAHHQPRKLWQIWLTLGALVVVALVFLGVWAVSGGMLLVSVSSSLLDAHLLSQGLVTVIDSADNLRFFVSLGALGLKTSYYTMQQPLFWGCMAMAVMLTWSWIRLMKLVVRRNIITIEMIL